MRRLVLVAAVAALTGGRAVHAQELEPRAYAVTPVGVNFFVFAYGRSSGDVAFDPTLPFEDVSASIHTAAVGYLRSLNVLGRSANVAVSLPIVAGSLQGIAFGEFARATRRGLGDPRVRFAMNLVGGPAVSASEFGSFRQNTILGVSLVAVPPGGSYSSERLINIGSNRWAFKPELGLSKRLSRWFVDVYAGVWLFAANDDFFGGSTRRQAPLGSAQLHVSYTLRPGLWAAFDANFYTGGRTDVDGRNGVDFQRNSRIGGTLSVPLTRRQSVKVSASFGAVTSVGADFASVGVGYQLLWGGGL